MYSKGACVLCKRSSSAASDICRHTRSIPMRQKSFLVTGATGDTGRYTTALLLERGHHVRALAHHEDARSEALKNQGAEIILGDLCDFTDVRRALQGVDGAYFVFPLLPGIVQATAFFAQAAREAKLDTIVNMSQIVARPDAKSHASLNHWVAECGWVARVCPSARFRGRCHRLRQWSFHGDERCRGNGRWTKAADDSRLCEAARRSVRPGHDACNVTFDPARQ